MPFSKWVWKKGSNLFTYFFKESVFARTVVEFHPWDPGRYPSGERSRPDTMGANLSMKRGPTKRPEMISERFNHRLDRATKMIELTLLCVPILYTCKRLPRRGKMENVPQQEQKTSRRLDKNML